MATSYRTHPKPSPLGQEDRRTALLELVVSEGYCSAAQLSRDLGVSEMTIRRDIRELAERGLARSVYGGITTLQDSALTGTEFSARAAVAVEQKRRIAREAARLVRAASTIALDSGTTTAELARALPPDEGLTVVTGSLPVISALAQLAGVRLIALGGTFHPDTQSFASSEQQAMAHPLDMFFLAASAVRNQRIYCRSYFDAEVKRALISRAAQVVVLADSSKFGASADVMVAPVEAVNTIITDDDRPEDVLRHARADGETGRAPEIVQLTMAGSP